MSDPIDVTLERYRRVVLACAVMNFRQVARSVTARFDDQLRPVGLRATQLNLLMAIETSTAVTITDLAEILAMDRTTMTRNLKLLRQRKGAARPPRRCRCGRKLKQKYSTAWARSAGRHCSASWRRLSRRSSLDPAARWWRGRRSSALCSGRAHPDPAPCRCPIA